MRRVVSTCNIGLICRKLSCRSSLIQAGADAAPPAVQNINSTAGYIDQEPKVDDRGNSNLFFRLTIQFMSQCREESTQVWLRRC